MSAPAPLGRGWRFPLFPRPADRELAFEEGTEKVRQAMWLVLDTEPGERVMRPSFGCGLRRYLMKPNSNATRTLIAQDVGRALATWEPRVEVQAVNVTAGDEDPALVLIHVAYTHVRDARPGNLVYPFYLE
jgi:phage baseplate assembly protein W